MDWDIVINKRNTVYDNEDIEQAFNVANGIIKAIKDGQYIEGKRNDMAVDLCCSMWMLGYGFDEPESVAARLKNEGYLDQDQKADLIDRIDKLEDYYEYWLNDWDSYWIMPWEWSLWNDNSAQHGYFEI